MSSALVDLLRSRCAGGVALALSGGCDSALLLAVLARLRQEKDFPFLAVHIQTPLQTAEEGERCRRLAARFQVELITVSPDVLTLPAVCGNRRDRCYHCKKMIFRSVLAAAEERQIPLVIDGTNADDCKEYRPGRQALAELGIFSPLAEAGLTKPQVRQLAAEYGLEEAHLPASACLACCNLFEKVSQEASCLFAVEASSAGVFLVLCLTDASDVRVFRVRVHEN